MTPPDARYRQVAGGLVDRIRSGDLPPGSRLPSWRDLAVTVHTDGRPVGERSAKRALAWLGAAGWAVSREREGWWVVGTPPEGWASLEERVADHERRLTALEQARDTPG